MLAYRLNPPYFPIDWKVAGDADALVLVVALRHCDSSGSGLARSPLYGCGWSAMLISAGQEKHRSAACCQWWLSGSRQALLQPWPKVVKGKMRSSSYEL